MKKVMSKEIGITKSECHPVEYCGRIIMQGEPFYNVNDDLLDSDCCEEYMENAKFFSEAWKVCRESNRTPSQLLEERDRMLECLKEVKEWASDYGMSYDIFEKLDQTIKDIEK